MVDDGVDGNGGLTGLAVANDELPLASADGYHCIHGFKSRLQGLVHGLTEDYTGGFALQWHRELLALDVAPAVKGLTQGADNPAHHIIIDLHRHNPLGAPYGLSLLNVVGGAEQHSAHVVLFQVHNNARHAPLKLQQLATLGILESIDACHAIAHLQYGADLLKFYSGVYACQLLTQHSAHLAWSDF